MSEHQSSTQIDTAKINDTFLTLAKWQPNPEYTGSYEIGWRTGESFKLIQWDRMPSWKAWDVVKRLCAKGRNVGQVYAVLNRLERN